MFIELNKVELLLLLLLLYRRWLPLFEKIIPSVAHHYTTKGERRGVLSKHDTKADVR
jgi:hypothetical protein